MFELLSKRNSAWKLCRFDLIFVLTIFFLFYSDTHSGCSILYDKRSTSFFDEWCSINKMFGQIWKLLFLCSCHNSARLSCSWLEQDRINCCLYYSIKAKLLLIYFWWLLKNFIKINEENNCSAPYPILTFILRRVHIHSILRKHSDQIDGWF